MKLVGDNIFKEEDIYLSDKLVITSKEYPDSHLKIKYFSKKEPIFYKRQRWFKGGKVYNTWGDWGSKVQLSAKDVESLQFIEVGTGKVQRIILSTFCVIYGGLFEEIKGEYYIIQPEENYKKATLEVFYENKFHSECFENNKTHFISMSSRIKYNEIKIPKNYFVSMEYT